MVRGGRSSLEQVIINDTTAANYMDWALTGAVNFYKSDVDLKYVTFDKTLAEDAINIVHSQFAMDNVKVTGSVSDGFDGDFTDGVITNSTFADIGGDGIDFSGSTIKVSDSHFDNIHDKAISVGEASSLSAKSVTIDNSGTAVVSKDGSDVYIADSVLTNIENSSLMSYTKKPQYDGARLQAINITYPDHPLAVISQKGNQLLLDGRTIGARKVDIDKLYKDGYMKK